MTPSYDNFTWRKSRTGIWERDIDEAEQFYATLSKLHEGSGRMFFAITSHISLSVTPAQYEPTYSAARRFGEVLQAAWLRLRFEHPTIGSQVLRDPASGKWTKRYETFFDDAAREQWLERTFHVIPSAITGEDWANDDPPAPTLPSLFVLTPPVEAQGSGRCRRDIVFRSPHDVIDGIGTLHLLNNFVTYASEALRSGFTLPVFAGSEAGSLSPPYRLAAAVPLEPTPTQKDRLAQIKEDAEVESDGVETIGIPFESGALVRGKHQRVARKLPKHLTDRICAILKTSNATVTHAFHTAIAMSMRDVQPPKATDERVRYVNYILRNERNSCVAPFNTPKHAAAVYHSLPSTKLVVDMKLLAGGNTLIRSLKTDERKDEFRCILDYMTKIYHKVRDDPDHYALAPYIWRSFTPELPAADTASGLIAVPPPNPLPSVSISSMGVVDRIIKPGNGHISVDNPWVTGEELGNGLGLFLGTFKGDLYLSAAYNGAWYDRDEVQDFIRRCEEIVLDWI